MVRQDNFNNFTMIAIMAHVKAKYPDRCYGVILKDESYIPLKNESQHPTEKCKVNHNIIDKYVQSGQLKGIAFSQEDKIKPSAAEMKIQIKYNSIICYVAYDGKRITEYHCFGDSLPVAEYKGRDYICGYFDCYGLIRDYYRKDLSITLKELPRSSNFKPSSNNLGYFADEYFNYIDMVEVTNEEMKIGDIIVFKSGKTPCHLAVYYSEGCVLHQDPGRLSRIVPISSIRWEFSKAYRHKSKI